MWTKLFPHLIIWAVLATVTIILAVYRRRVDQKADDMLHVLDSETQITANQVVVAKKIQGIDRWGKVLTVVVALYLLGIVGYYLFSLFTDTTIPNV
jgi:hypothetical protein